MNDKKTAKEYLEILDSIRRTVSCVAISALPYFAIITAVPVFFRVASCAERRDEARAAAAQLQCTADDHMTRDEVKELFAASNKSWATIINSLSRRVDQIEDEHAYAKARSSASTSDGDTKYLTLSPNGDAYGTAPNAQLILLGGDDDR